MKKIIIAITSFILIIFTILIFSKPSRYELMKKANMISAGSYAFSETYNLNYSEAKVIKAIKEFKEQNPIHQVPEVSISSNSSFVLEDKRSENGLWFIVYFYDANKNKILNIAVRGNETNTNLEFESVNDGLKIGNWKRINLDFSYDENEQLKKRFEESFLNSIKKLLESS